MTRTVLSGIKPTGSPTLGNLLGAIQHWVAGQDDTDGLFCVVDLHALTVPHQPGAVRSRTLEIATLLLAAGIDPTRSTVFVQSHVPAHAELHWLMESTAHDGEMRRMVQYKEKSARGGPVRLSLLAYPALMTADILLYGIDEVPVGDDQRQHVELARDLAQRFNSAYGDTFVVPRAVTPPSAARIMDLADPTAKMGKSDVDGRGTIRLLDPPDVVRRTVARAVTDSDGDVRYEPATKPGVANLLEILAGCTERSPEQVAAGYCGYGALKSDVADAVVALLRPLQARYAELAAEPEHVAQVLCAGAAVASARAADRLAAAKTAIGLLPPTSAGRPHQRAI